MSLQRKTTDWQVWDGKLGALWPALMERLNADLEARGPGRWVGYAMPRGALVAARYEKDDAGDRPALVVRLARRSRPDGEVARKKWELEVATFERFLPLAPFTRSDDPNAKGVAVIYREQR